MSTTNTKRGETREPPRVIAEQFNIVMNELWYRFSDGEVRVVGIRIPQRERTPDLVYRHGRKA